MHKRKVYMTTLMAFLMIATLLSMVLMANAALGVSLNPTSGEPGDSVEVTVTDLAA
jgi:hypothetical protein